jgi:hypothetical protein
VTEIETPGPDAEIEQALTELAWADPGRVTDAGSALAELGVPIPDGIRLEVRVQRRDTLYFVIPPAVDDGGVADHVVDQMDLWGSGDQFVWILPQDRKLTLLELREGYRRSRTGPTR